ncbi:ChrR family anti-sigma-E factor [Rhodopila sp.]|uniref:ChrR family anti-sigma-E factor n=1 Tax=Rhodopila sp. TaxID=2480087 RepID=UPI003D09AE29
MITHHPSDTTLLSYATGTLPEALAIVLATHLTYCPACRQALADLEAVGGALLQEIQPIALSPELADAAALDRLLAREPKPAPVPPVVNPELRAPLDRVPLGERWWPIGIGVRWRPLRVTGAAWGGLILAQPGRSLPRHGHDGLELTCLLSGSFADGGQAYIAGDLAEPEVDHDHPPIVIGTDPCLCVIATEGMRLRGFLGLAQRLVGL